MSTQPLSSFGDLLKQHRRRVGLTQERLAERAGISVDAISALERGARRAPHKDTVALLAKALRLSPEECARLEAAARGSLASELPSDTRLHLVRADENQALLEPPNPPVTSPAVPAAPDEAARLPATGNLGATQATQPSPPESAPPQVSTPLPARRQRKRVVLGSFALLVLLVSASSGLAYWLKLWPFGKNAAAATPAPAYVYAQPTHRGGTITFSTPTFFVGGFPPSTNPWFLSSGYELGLVAALWGNPYVTSPSAAFLPDELAKLPSLANGGISRDGLTITMRLRPDLKWSDGQPLTADDFAYWLEVELDTTTGTFPYGTFDQIVSHQAPDAQTLVLHYQQPYGSALFYLPLAAPRHAWGSIPHKELSQRAEVNLYPSVTSGPFKLESYLAGQSLTLVPNPYYTSTTLHRSLLDRLIYTAYPDQDALLTAFEVGQTDYAEGFTVNDLPKVGGQLGVHISRAISYTHLDFNLSQSVLQDFQVRKAIEEAIDRCQIIQMVFAQSCATLRVDTILPAPSPDYDPTIKTYGYDLAQARQDMQVAGWDCATGGVCTRGGKVFPPLKLVTTNDSLARQQVAGLIKQYLADLGITVSLSYYPQTALFTDYASGGILATGQYDLALFAYTFGLDDDGNLYGTFHSSQIPSASNPTGGNLERVNDPLIDADLDQGRMTLDMAARTHIYKALQQVLVQKVYVVPLYLNVNITFVSPNIGNQQNNPIVGPGQGNLWNVGDWFVIR